MSRRGRPPHPDILTPREWEVLELVERGCTNDEIASRLGISFAGAKFHVSEILGKLHLSSREEAAQWHRARVARTSVWATMLDWLRGGPHRAAEAVSAGVIVAGITAVGIMIWALGYRSNDAAAVPEPMIWQAPADLQDARWMNNGALILGARLRPGDEEGIPGSGDYVPGDLDYYVVNRAYQEVFSLPADVRSVDGSLTDSRVVALRGDSYTITVWDAANGEVLQEMVRAWHLGTYGYALIDATIEELFGDGAATWYASLDQPDIVLNGDQIEVWDDTRGRARSAPASAAATDIIVGSQGWVSFKGDPPAEYVEPSKLVLSDAGAGPPGAPEPIRSAEPPSSFLDPSWHCGAWLSPNHRFAVVRARTCAGPCRLVDVARSAVLRELRPESLDFGFDGCGWVSWSADERDVLISNYAFR